MTSNISFTFSDSILSTDIFLLVLRMSAWASSF